MYEKEKPLGLQLQSTRWIDPTAYDWPHAWWTESRFPWDGALALPFQIDAGLAWNLAADLAWKLRRATQSDPAVRIVREEVGALADLQKQFSLVSDCRGVKGERNQCGRFHGLPFWTNRDLRGLVRQKARELQRAPRVLISGGGDGAIQDFLLLATGVASITDLAVSAGLARREHLLEQFRAGSTDPLARFEKESLSMEERTWREFCWRDPRDKDAVNRMSAALDRFYRGWIELLGADLKPLPESKDRCEFTLVRRTQHHSTCYALNRVLAIIAERQFTPRLVTGDLEQLGITEGDFDLSIVRHGIDEYADGPAVRSQLLPFRVNATY
jgi:hypothetical protein